MIFTPRFYKSVRRTSSVLFFIYIGILIYLLFLSPAFGRTPQADHHYNLIPFKTIGNFIRYRALVSRDTFIINIIGNVVAFIPMGLFVPIIFHSQRKFIKVIFASAHLSLLAEVVQYTLMIGSFDVDDLILNTLGGIIGYVFFSVFYSGYYWRKRKRHNIGKKG